MSSNPNEANDGSSDGAGGFDVDWVVVGSRCVLRLLGILDPDQELPLADDFDSACQHLEHLVCRRYPIPGADIRQTGFN